MAAMSHEAKRGAVLAGELDEVRTDQMAVQTDALEIGGGILHAGDMVERGKLGHGFDRHVDHRARRNVVDDDRNADGVVNRSVVRQQTGLVGLVVIWRHHKQGVGPDPLRLAAELDRFGSIVRTCARYHRNATCRNLYA